MDGRLQRTFKAFSQLASPVPRITRIPSPNLARAWTLISNLSKPSPAPLGALPGAIAFPAVRGGLRNDLVSCAILVRIIRRGPLPVRIILRIIWSA